MATRGHAAYGRCRGHEDRGVHRAGGATVTLDGTGSVDPEAGALGFAWSCDGVGLSKPARRVRVGSPGGVESSPAGSRSPTWPPAAGWRQGRGVRGGLRLPPLITALRPRPSSARTGGTPATEPVDRASSSPRVNARRLRPESARRNDAPASLPARADGGVVHGPGCVGRRSPCNTVLTVDRTPPQVTCPAGITVEWPPPAERRPPVRRSRPASPAPASTDVGDPSRRSANDAPAFSRRPDDGDLNRAGRLRNASGPARARSRSSTRSSLGSRSGSAPTRCGRRTTGWCRSPPR